MVCVKGALVFYLVTVVFASPVSKTLSQDVIQENEVVSDFDDDLFRLKKSVEVNGGARFVEGKILPDQKSSDVIKKYETYVGKPNQVAKVDTRKIENEFNDKNIKHFNDEKKVDLVSLEKKITENLEREKNVLKDIIEHENNGMDTVNDINISEEDLERNRRQFLQTYPQMGYNGMSNPITPVQIDSRFGPLNEGGLNYIQVNPEQIGSYIKQGLPIREDWNKKITGQEASAVDPQIRNPSISTQIPVYQFGPPQHQIHQQHQQQPVIVIQPIVIPAHKDEGNKCPTIAIPVIKDKHPHIEIPHIQFPQISVKPTSAAAPVSPISSLLNTPLLPNLLTTILPALIPLLIKKKDEPKKKPVVYLSKQFLINPNVVPSITIPSISAHPKQTKDVSVVNPTFKEVETFIDDLMENNATFSHQYFRSAIENEEIRLANLQNGAKSDPMVGYTGARVPEEFRGKLMRRMAELDAEVGVLTSQLSQVQSQQRLAHAIAATIE